MKKNIEITSQLISRHNSIVEQIQGFPDTIFVGRLESGEWAKLSYPKHGMGLACFRYEQDGKSWYSAPGKQNLEMVSMLRQEAVKLARREKVQYLHLLSDDVSKPFNHLKIT